jgi:tagatose 6-phosphate kinase
MSGSWPAGGPADGYAQMIARGRYLVKSVILDCNGEQLSHALDQNPFTVPLNTKEGKEGLDVFGEEDPARIAGLLSEKCAYAAVKAGAEGLFLIKGEELVHAACAVESVYSTVGSGDCLLVGLAVASAWGLGLTDAARLAVACGAAYCIRPQLGMLHRADVDALQQKAKIKTLRMQR